MDASCTTSEGLCSTSSDKSRLSGAILRQDTAPPRSWLASSPSTSSNIKLWQKTRSRCARPCDLAALPSRCTHSFAWSRCSAVRAVQDCSTSQNVAIPAKSQAIKAPRIYPSLSPLPLQNSTSFPESLAYTRCSCSSALSSRNVLGSSPKVSEPKPAPESLEFSTSSIMLVVITTTITSQAGGQTVGLLLSMLTMSG